MLSSNMICSLRAMHHRQAAKDKVGFNRSNRDVFWYRLSPSSVSFYNQFEVCVFLYAVRGERSSLVFDLLLRGSAIAKRRASGAQRGIGLELTNRDVIIRTVAVHLNNRRPLVRV